ncbi:vacuolar import and degradation protein 27 [Irineochytrium annulatum]|nr:vacuolar import and degradation protein 27 [Irineochytrium annulatum]
MNFVKSFKSMIFGESADSAALGQLISGQLHKLTPRGRLPKELLFPQCFATIKRTTVPKNYQLLVTRIRDEGENDEDDDNLDEDEDRDLKRFVVDKDIRFVRVDSDEGAAFQWTYEDVTYEFVPDPDRTTMSTLKSFEHTVYTCMFERETLRDVAEAGEKEVEAYVKNLRTKSLAAVKAAAAAAPTSVAKATPKKSPKRAQAQSDSPGSIADPMSVSATPVRKADTLGGMAGACVKETDVDGDVLAEVEAELYLYDHRACQFMRMKENVTAKIIRTAPFVFVLLVSSGDDRLIGQPLDSEMSGQFNCETRAFAWIFRESDDSCYPWSLKFFDAESEITFRECFGACMYETNNRDAFSKVKNKGEREYLISAYQEDVEMEDAEFHEAEQGVEEAEPAAAEEPKKVGKSTVDTSRRTRLVDYANDDSEEEDEEEEEEDKEEKAPGDKGAKISQLTVGYKDRSFYLKGSTIGVLKHRSAEGGIEYSTTIKNVSSPKGSKDAFTPSKMMLHNQDTSMLLMKPGDEHSVYRMDLVVGKVVEELNVHDVMPVDDIIPDFKTAQITGNQTLIGINHNAIFRIDPRLSGAKMVMSESKQYAVKNGFSCAATTGNGAVAVASTKGDVRLYDKLGMRAKTHLPGLGDPIIGVDCTASGRYIIATCKNYLLLICTEYKDGDGDDAKIKSGFSKSMADKKPAPRKLQLKPEHVAFMACPVSFTPARFNIPPEGGEERSIVTSSGPYVVTWDFAKVRAGRLHDYTIKKYGEVVVADDFRYGQDKEILVALSENVHSVAKGHLRTPAKLIKSRSSIVNSPY